MAFFNIFSKDKKEKLDEGLDKTKQSFFSKLTRAVGGKSTVDAEVLDNLEEMLVLTLMDQQILQGFTCQTMEI